MRLSAEQLAEIAQELAARPGHETVRSDVRQLLIDGLRVPRADVQLEAHIPEVRGRIDALLGRTVLEFKSDPQRAARAGRDFALTEGALVFDRLRSCKRVRIQPATGGSEVTLIR